MNLVPFSMWLFVFETLVFLDSSHMVLKKRCVGCRAAVARGNDQSHFAWRARAAGVVKNCAGSSVHSTVSVYQFRRSRL